MLGKDQKKLFFLATIKAFNLRYGSKKVAYSRTKHDENDFLEEEKQLIRSVALEIGNLIERKQIIDKEEVTKRR